MELFWENSEQLSAVLNIFAKSSITNCRPQPRYFSLQLYYCIVPNNT